MEDCNREKQWSLLEDALSEIIRGEMEKRIKMAVHTEFEMFMEKYAHLRDERGRSAVVRNGSNPERRFVTNAGVLNVQVPRVRDRRSGVSKRAVFHSALLPPYLRRSRHINDLIPFLYLKGISTSSFEEVISHIVGSKVRMSAATVVRLKEKWEKEYEKWRRRNLSKRDYIYWWVDGVYFNVRLEGERNCILMIIGVTQDGHKELLAISNGVRESELSWMELLLDLKQRGIRTGPLLATGDGSLGFWKALYKVFPLTKQQRCWVHKTANVLDKLPKKLQEQAKKDIHRIYLAESKEKALEAFSYFEKKYAHYEKAVQCLVKSKDETLAFYDFPKEHWRHIRSTNPIESAFATVRLRTHKTKGCGSSKATLTMVFKLAQAAEKGWQRIHSHELLVLVASGVKFQDGVMHAA
jgi:transposase-like protein